MEKQINKYPYNARSDDEIKTFLSDKICDQVVRKKKEIIVSVAIIFGTAFGLPREAQSIGLTARTVSASNINNRLAPKYVLQHAPKVNSRVDKIVMRPNNNNRNRLIPLMYINGHSVYINEKLLKRLKVRGGDLESTVAIVAIGLVVYVICQLSGTDPTQMFAEGFQVAANWRAPKASPSVVPSPSATQLSAIPTKAQEFNDWLLKFNEPKKSYDFVMSAEEAQARIDEAYPGAMQMSSKSNTYVSDVKAAGKIYHASQLGVNPEKYGVTNEQLQRISQIGIHNYAREGKPLPPIELIREYQMAIKDICDNGEPEPLKGTYQSKAEQKVHKAIYHYDKITRKVAGFYAETGELITATKYRIPSFDRFIGTRNLGTLN